jgi:N-acetylmuramoyl-L-alanine amidase
MDEVYAIEKEKEEEERRKQEEAARQEAIKNAEANKQYAATVEELDLLAALIYCEANIEPYEAKVAVGAVVMNRLKKGTYGKTLVDVIYMPEHFTPATNGLVNKVLKEGKVNESCYQAAREALAGVDNTKGALYFNDWHPELDGKGVMYGNMVFYYKWIPH